ncbi:MAG: ECF transporter S component [Corallococcus sp.]|nr:ECF transporter S component [Corallococcus sp.]MCM1359421.1 ECF transporter S component [Corallococcus sp.]MCM1394864.1 ECF transporter S component [Corallococcus sp.]
MNNTLKMTFTAVLCALSVVTNAISVQISGSNYLSFTYVPCFIAAIYLGIIPATAVGFLGDLIAGLLFPKGAYNVLIGISSTLIGTIPAVLYKINPKRRFIDLIASLLLCSIICTAGLNTYALWLTYGAKNGKTFWVYLGGRLPFQLLNTVVNGLIIGVLQQTKALDRLFAKLQLKPNKAENENEALQQTDSTKNCKDKK